MDNKDLRKDFPIFENRDIVYLDSGATTQRPIQVIDAIDNFYKKIMPTLTEVHIL